MNIEAALIEAAELVAREGGRPDIIYYSDAATAVMAVAGFLRWGFEDSYSAEQWAEEGDFFLIVHEPE